ncbi:MAG TPA: transglutaminase-like domain-containing protein, partial [Polyangiales bacterium]|nr:transglutaminase-like domain-containing protein [Polyangiales bacterium]
MVYTDHPDGFAHTRSSIRKAAELARQGQESLPIVQLARRIVHDVPGKAYDDELRALYIWVREHVRYRKDPISTEWLQSAERTVHERAGDCDDLAILLASLAGALGHTWRLLTVGPTPTRQAHIAVQVSADGGATWVTLDPVMEPRQPTTKLRTDVGAYGRTPRAPSVRLWDQRGAPMQLGSYPDAQLKSLWLWQPYFPMGPYAQLPQRANADPRYRAAGAPGAPSAIMSGLGALQAGMSGCCRLGDPLYLYLDDRGVDTTRTDAMGGYPYKLGSIWGSIKKIGKGVAHAASGAVRAVGKVAKAVVKSPVGKIAAPVLALNVDPKLKALRNAGLKAIPIPAAQALLKAGTAAEHVAASVAAKGKAKPKPGSAAGHGLPRPPSFAQLTRGLPVPRTTIVKHIVAPAAAKATASDAWKKPHPELRKRYPSDARQTYDARAGVFRVFIPHAGGRLSGVGALVPTLTLSLGAAASSPASSGDVASFNRAQAARAQLAVNAVKAFIASRADRRPPGKALPQVLAFQQADGQRPGGGVPLKADGLWGNNTRAAAAYYLGTSAASLPANLPALTVALS